LGCSIGFQLASFSGPRRGSGRKKGPDWRDSAQATPGGAAAKLLSKDEARRIVANIAKLPVLLRRR